MINRTFAVRRSTAMLLLLGFLGACGDGPAAPSAAQPSDESKVPTEAPAPDVPDAQPFPALQLEVRQAGTEAPDAERVPWPVAARPRYAEGARRAWIVALLFGLDGAALWDAELVVFHGEGQRTRIPNAFRTGPSGVWALDAGPGGKPRVRLLDPSRPFPTGDDLDQGSGDPHASGEPAPLAGVSRLRVVLSGAARPAVARPRDTGPRAQREALRGIRVRIDGVEAAPDPARLRTLATIRIRAEAGRPEKDAWDLRAVVKALGGASARLVRVEAAGGPGVGIPAEDWADPERLPVLRANRKGSLKFHWATRAGDPDAAPALRDVIRLVIETR